MSGFKQGSTAGASAPIVVRFPHIAKVSYTQTQEMSFWNKFMPSGAGQGNPAPLSSEDQQGTKLPRRESKGGGKPWGKGAPATLSITAGGRGARQEGHGGHSSHGSHGSELDELRACVQTLSKLVLRHEDTVNMTKVHAERASQLPLFPHFSLLQVLGNRCESSLRMDHSGP